MIIQYSKVCDFAIGADGQISKTAVWTLQPDSDITTPAAFEAFRAEVETWSGSIGDDFRIPATEEPFYTSDENWYVSAIGAKMAELTTSPYVSCTVTFTGQARHSEAEMININEHISEKGEKEKTAKWRISSANLVSWLPAIGDVVDWAGATYLCDDVIKNKLISDNADSEWDVTIKAKEIHEFMVGIPCPKETADGSIKTAKWMVSGINLGSFFARNPIGESASSWAGTDYYISSLSAEAIGIFAYYVTVEAKKKPQPQRQNTTPTFDIKIAEYKLTAEQCGWKRSSEANKSWKKITDWKPDKSCPLKTTEAIPEKNIDLPLKCFMVVETSYLPGSMKDLQTTLDGWIKIDGAIEYNLKCGNFGEKNWLKINQENIAEVTGTDGKTYTRVTRYYQAAPAGFEWNKNFFSK